MNDIERYKKRREERLKKRMDGFNENDHPRDENGRFVSGGGGEKPQSTGAIGAKAEDVMKDGLSFDAAEKVSSMLKDMKEGDAVTVTNWKNGKEMRHERTGLNELAFKNTNGKNEMYSPEQAQKIVRESIFYGKKKPKFEEK